MWRVNSLALAIAAGLGFPFATIANDVNDVDDSGAEHIVVIGQVASMNASIQQQRESDRIESVVKADGIGQLPDDNAAEALQRLPGISIERDQGEGRFVRIRGLSPDLNAVTINGSVVPAPESGRRAVALDVLSAELLQSVAVSKTLTPDMDANSIGGTIAVESLSAFDHQDGFYSLSAEAGYDSNSAQTSPKYSGSFSRRLSDGSRDTFGVAAAFSYNKRQFGSDNVETGGDWDFDDENKLEGFELRDYRIERERTAAAVNFDFRPDDNSRYFLRTLFSRFGDAETRHALVVEFDDPVLANESVSGEMVRELKNREEIQTIQSLVLGGEKYLNDWAINAQIGLSKADEDNPDQMDPAAFETDDSLVSYADTSRPRLMAETSVYDAANFALDEVEMADSLTTDQEHNIRVDLSREFKWGKHPAQVKFGVKASRREKDNNVDVWVFEDLEDAGIDGDELLLSSLQNDVVDYSMGNFGPAIDGSRISRLLSGLDRSDYVDDEASAVEDFAMTEDVDAAYFMQTVDLDNWRVIAGVRYEGSSFTAAGTGLREGEFESIQRENEEKNWLLGLHARYQFNDDDQLRLALSHSVVRPAFEERAPGFVIDGDEAEFGNPDLDALTSRNIDMGYEHYFGSASLFSIFAFHKSIEHFVYQTDVAGSGDWIDFDEAVTFVNGEAATLKGLELNWSHQFDSGLLAAINFTYVDSVAEIANGKDETREIALPSQSDQTGNILLGYENERISLRLTVNYKSSYLLEVADITDARYDVFVDAQTQIDLSARYQLGKGLYLFAEARNLGDEPYYVYSGRSAFNHQYEEYGPSYSVGLSYRHF